MMFSYYLGLAFRSLRRSRGLTLLMVLAIGFGVAASMTTYSVFRAVSGDPIPWKSSKLFVPQIDVWGPTERGPDGEPPDGLDYADAMALMRDHRAELQSAIYAVSPSVIPAAKGISPSNVSGFGVYSEFFPMVDAPFQYGSGWSADADTHRAAVVVINSTLNEQLFGGHNSVGKTIDIEGKDYQVVGVLNHWNPQPIFFDVRDTGGFGGDGPDLFIPFERGIAVGMPNGGSQNCSVMPTSSGFVGLQQSSCVWISYLAQLNDRASVRAYRVYLDGYADAQQAAGRFSWSKNNRLRDVPAFMDFDHVVPDDTRVSLLVALGLLVVCLVNTVGLLLAKFLRRSGEIGVRRALGAPRRAIYAQFLIEAGMVGVAGGVLGLLLTGVGVASVSLVLPTYLSALAKVDFSLLAMTLTLAIVATLLAGIYPTFRASRIQPAWQLKSN